MSYTGMCDDDGAAQGRPKKMGLRRIYCHEWLFRKNSVDDWDKLYLTVTDQSFTIADNTAELLSKGVDIIWCTVGGSKSTTNYTASPPDGAARYVGAAGDNAGLLMPINIADDPYDAASYQQSVNYVKNVAMIYGRTTHVGGLTASELHEWDGTKGTKMTGGPLNNGTGLGGVQYIELLNECWIVVGFPIPYGTTGDRGGILAWDYRAYSVFLKASYDAIKAADPTMKVIVGGFWDDGKLTDYNGILAAYQTEHGVAVPSDIIFAYHNYPYDVTDVSDPRTGAIPEETAPPADWYNGVRGLLSNNRVYDAKGYDWMNGEFSWDSSAASPRPYVPITGYTAVESMGILDVRMMMLLACGKRCVGMVKYNMVNQSTNPDAPLQFGNMGFFLRDYDFNFPLILATRKANAAIMDTLMEEMGDCTMPLQLISFGNTVRVAGMDGTNLHIASWTRDSAPTYQTYNLN